MTVPAWEQDSGSWNSILYRLGRFQTKKAMPLQPNQLSPGTNKVIDYIRIF